MRTIAICIILAVFLSGCASDSFYEYGKTADVKGKWVKVQPETPLGGYYITITFDEKIFYYKLNTYVDYMDEKDSCRGNHSGWAEYAAGAYSFKNGKIIFHGNWTDSTFRKNKESGCFHTGEFNEAYWYRLKGKDTLILNSREAKFDDSLKYNHVYDKMVFVRSEIYH